MHCYYAWTEEQGPVETVGSCCIRHPASRASFFHIVLLAESNTTTNMQKRTHLIATLLAELVLRLEGALLGPLVADGLLGLGKVQGWREGAHGYRRKMKRRRRADGRTARRVW